MAPSVQSRADWGIRQLARPQVVGVWPYFVMSDKGVHMAKKAREQGKQFKESGFLPRFGACGCSNRGFNLL